MTLLSRASVGLVVALLAATPGQGSARGQTPTQPPAPSAPPPSTPQTPPVDQQTPDPAATEPARQGRPEREPRPSRSEPAANSQRGGADARASRQAGPTRQELTFTANLLGGYDDNLTAGLGTGAGVAPTAMASGTTASLDGTLNYRRGNELRSLTLDTSGNVMAYPDQLDDLVAGGTVTLGARTTMGRANTVAISQRAGYEPLINVLSQGGNGIVLPPDVGAPSPTTGLFSQRSISSNSAVSLETRWGRRDTTTVGYGYNLRNFLDDPTGEEAAQQFGDNRAHSVTTTYRRTLSTAVRARADYQYQNLETEDVFSTGSPDAISTRPTRTHRVEGGTDVEHALDRQGRRLTWTLTAGAGRIETISSASLLPYSAWIPVGAATMRLEFSPRWSLDGDYRRDFTLLQGITDEVYATDSVTLSTGGLVASRTQLRVGGTYANFRTPVASGVTDTFNVYGGLLQVRQFVTDTLALTASYNYYHHVYSNPAALPEGFPAEFDRNAVRVGITVVLPLVGAPAVRSATAGSR